VAPRNRREIRIVLGSYTSEVWGIAEELVEYLKGPLRQAAFDVLEEVGSVDLLRMSEEETEAALKLLGQTRTQRDKALARLDDAAAATLVLRARHLGLASHRTLAFADRFESIPGKSYRGAAVYGAAAFLGARLAPPMSEVLPGWRGSSHDEDGSQVGTPMPRR
jgi:hypothetical protein